MTQTVASTSTSPAPFRLSSIMIPLVAIIAGVFMVVLDNTVMNVALPNLVTSLHTQLPTLQWTITGYMLAQAAVIPLAGWLSDRFGAKRIFLTSAALFTMGSILCATPNHVGLLIFFRVIQGLGGGFMLPVSMAYVYRLSPPHKIGVVMGMMGIPILFAPAMGPVIAGWLVQYHSWRWIFLLNAPVGLLSLFIGMKGLPRIDKHAVTEFDLLGTILGPIAFAALSYGVSEGASSWTSVKTLTGLIVGGIALILFIVAELRAKTPLLELRVFKSTDFSLAILVQWVGQFALFGSFFLVPQFLQQARGFGAFDTGLILMPQALASGLIMPFGGYLFDKIGARWLVIFGLGLVSGGLYQISQVTPTTVGHDLILPLVMNGAGMGLMMMPLNTHIINKAPRKLVSRVTSLTNALQQVVNSLSIATLVTILTSRVTSHINDAKTTLAHQGVPVDKVFGSGSSAGASILNGGGAGASAPGAGHAMTPQMLHMFDMVKQAIIGGAVKAFDDTFTIMMGVAIVGAVLGVVLRKGSHASYAPTPDGSAEGERENAAPQAGFMHS